MDASDDGLRQFAGRLREERERHSYSQEELADRAGLDRTYISGVERGKRNISLRNIRRLANALEIDIASLVASPPHDVGTRPTSLELGMKIDAAVEIECGFIVKTVDIIGAVRQTNLVLSSLPLTLFSTIDLKSQSGMVGAVFAAQLANAVGATPNPIEKGHPDIVPATAMHASEPELRNYPEGLEIKSTLGGVAKGSELRAGESRIEALVNVVWQAHHRDVRALMGLIWDFVGGTKSAPAHPTVTAVFYSDRLLEEDWGKISGTTGRNTKVTGMTVSGRRKMAAGAIAVINEPNHVAVYARCLGVGDLSHLSGLTHPRRS